METKLTIPHDPAIIGDAIGVLAGILGVVALLLSSLYYFG
jgi:hypothetical protein